MPEFKVIAQHFFKHKFCVKPYVPREPKRDPSNRKLNEHGIYIRESNSQPVPSQAGADTTRPQWRTKALELNQWWRTMNSGLKHVSSTILCNTEQQQIFTKLCATWKVALNALYWSAKELSPYAVLFGSWRRSYTLIGTSIICSVDSTVWSTSEFNTWIYSGIVINCCFNLLTYKTHLTVGPIVYDIMLIPKLYQPALPRECSREQQ